MVVWGQGDIGHGEITKGHEETLRGNGYIHYLDCDGFRDVYMPRLIKLNTLNMYDLMYVNHISINV